MNEDQQVPSDHDLPLSGVRVVDLSRLVSGNILTHVLADLGADVLKVEPPGRGDELRAWRRKGVSTYWLAYSRNKQSVTLDLRSEDGFAELRGLLAEADVLVENFRPGTLERMSSRAKRCRKSIPAWWSRASRAGGRRAASRTKAASAR